MNADEIVINVLVSLFFLFLGVLLNDRMIQTVYYLLTKSGIKDSANLNGLWVSEFSIYKGNAKKCYREVVLLKTYGQTIYGYHVEHEYNYEELKRILKDKSLKNKIRIKATILDNKNITGTWYHPNIKTRYHGALQLIVEHNCFRMQGCWTGINDSDTYVHHGKWKWTRLEEYSKGDE